MQLRTFLFITLELFAFQIGSAQSNDKAQLKKELKEEILAELTLATDSLKKEDTLFQWSKFTLHGYGVVNYYANDHDTDPDLRNKFDAERLNLYLNYHFNKTFAFKSEIEIEHGGTGSTLELDTQEEFGEFETEIEAGGEIQLEQIYIDIKATPWLGIKIGKFKNYFGTAQNLDTPDEYFTTYRPEMENTLLPVGFYETGVDFYGTFAKRFNYHLAVTSGFDSSGFSSRNWIRGGQQTKFEMVNADALALMTRLDYKFGSHKNTYAGVAFYIGDAAANRPKDDIDDTAYITMAEAHITIDEHPWRFSTMALYGTVENSALVSQRNTTLPNALGAKRTPVGKTAVGFSAELGYDILPLLVNDTKNMMLYPFVRYDYYDSMHQVESPVINNPRWERNSYTGGINWFIHPQIILKAQYNHKKLGSMHNDPTTLEPTGKKQVDNTFSTGVGFRF